jgi:two-component system alkaline phosphatase synthesis response regulator PhoP
MIGRTILVADDDRLVQSAIAQAARKYGCQIIAVLEGLQVVSIARRQRPDLIVLDLTFPDADGRYILAELQANADTKDIPVVVWSAHDPGPDRHIFLALGAEDYVEKTDAPSLLPKVKRILLRRNGPEPAHT